MEPLTSDSRLVMIATLAHPKDLCCMQASVDVLEKRHSSAKSVYYSRILKCRQIIFSEPQIIAAPILETESRMYIVMNRKFYECGEINVLLEKMKISGSEPVPVSNDIFEKCFRYTITTKIAPLWNQVKEYLVCGRSFMTSTEALPAVKIQIIINESKALMVVWSLRLMLEQTKIEDLGVPQNVNQDFMMNSISSISESHIETQWIHILPTFARRQIRKITRHIPESCPYKTYREMKRHWKNMYGYRLPEEEDEEDLTYYTISNSDNGTSLVIPSSCVRLHDVILLNQMNPIHDLEWFHDALLRKVPTICGQNIFISIRLAYAFPKEDDLSLGMYLNIPQGTSLNDIIESDPVIFSSSNSRTEKDVNKTEMNDLKNQTATQEDEVHNEISQSDNISSCEDKLLPDIEMIEKNTEFTPQHKPVINCDSTKSSSVVLRKPLQDIPQVLNLKNIDNWPGPVNRPDLDTKSLPLPTKKSIYPENCHNDTRFIQTTLSRIALSAQKIEAVVSSSGTQGMQSFYTFPAQNLLMEQTRDMLSSGNQQVNIISSNGQTYMPEKEISLKRDASLLGQSDILGLVKKKPRSRPQVQLDVDVELVARNNDLQRVNKITLVYWLRNKLVPCKVKDKKSDLVIKVMEYLHLPLEKVQ